MVPAVTNFMIHTTARVLSLSLPRTRVLFLARALSLSLYSPPAGRSLSLFRARALSCALSLVFLLSRVRALLLLL